MPTISTACRPSRTPAPRCGPIARRANTWRAAEAQRRLEQRSRDLFPWVDENMPLVRADRWLEGDASFTLGGVRFEVAYMGPPIRPRT